MPRFSYETRVVRRAAPMTEKRSFFVIMRQPPIKNGRLLIQIYAADGLKMFLEPRRKTDRRTALFETIVLMKIGYLNCLRNKNSTKLF